MAPRRDPAQTATSTRGRGGRGPVVRAALAPMPHRVSVRLCVVKYRREATIGPGYQPGAHRAGASICLRMKGVSMASLAESPRFLTVERASVILGVPVPTIQRQLRAKILPGVKLGRQWRIPESAITALEQRALKGGER